MATLAQVRDRVDDWLVQRWSIVVARQQNYYANHNGQYWQGLITHTDIPDHGDNFGDTVPDKLGDMPTDGVQSWNEFFPEMQSLPMPCRLSMSTYVGPLGAGFVARIDVLFRGQRYFRIQQYGPESWRNVPWTAWEDPDEGSP